LIVCRKGSRISEKAVAGDLKTFEISMRSSFDPAAILKVLRNIKAEKADIVHTHSSRDSWSSALPDASQASLPCAAGTCLLL
jgi:hypothetical protein